MTDTDQYTDTEQGWDIIVGETFVELAAGISISPIVLIDAVGAWLTSAKAREWKLHTRNGIEIVRPNLVRDATPST